MDKHHYRSTVIWRHNKWKSKSSNTAHYECEQSLYIHSTYTQIAVIKMTPEELNKVKKVKTIVEKSSFQGVQLIRESTKNILLPNKRQNSPIYSMITRC